MQPWEQINLVNNGEPVIASVPNRPLSELADRTDYLKERMDAGLIGQAIFARNKPVTAECIVGTPVYYNSTTSRFEPARAAVDFNSENVYGLASTALCVGIVYQKLSETTADIVLNGWLDNLDLTALLGADYASGAYYLSGANAGQLTLARPPVGIIVLYVQGTSVYVKPEIKEVLEDHIHWKVRLDSRPCMTDAETSSSSSGEWDQPTADELTYTGWLPVHVDLFATKSVPVNAIYGYNITAQEDLARIFPPQPPENSYVEINGIGMSASIVTNADGIWWVDDSDVPWGDYVYDRTTVNNGVGFDENTMIFWFTKMTFQTNNTVVTSLFPGSSKVTVKDVAGESASQGCLYVDINNNFETDPGNDTITGLAIKEISDNTVFKGPVVEGLKSGSTYISVTGGTADSTNYRSGKLVVGFTNPALNALRGPIEIVSLDNVRKDIYYNVPSLEFLPDVEASILCKADINNANIIQTGDISIKIGVLLLGKVTDTLPDLLFNYGTVTTPSNSTPIALNLTDWADSGSSVALPTAGAITANYYKLVYSTPVTIDKTDVFLFTITRTDIDAYDGSINLLNIWFELEVA